MSLCFTPRALAEARRMKAWWRANRPAAPDAFERELEAAPDRFVQAPASGSYTIMSTSVFLSGACC